jgi:hypothetical protein
LPFFGSQHVLAFGKNQPNAAGTSASIRAKSVQSVARLFSANRLRQAASEQLRGLAIAVRRDAFRCNPEQIAEQKDSVAHDLDRIAVELEAAR